MGRPKGSRNKRKASNDLASDLHAAGFDFAAKLLELLDYKVDLTPGNRVKLKALIDMMPYLYVQHKPVDPANMFSVEQVMDLLTRQAKMLGAKGPVVLPE